MEDRLTTLYEQGFLMAVIRSLKGLAVPLFVANKQNQPGGLAIIVLVHVIETKRGTAVVGGS